jgi:hypothetical protein
MIFSLHDDVHGLGRRLVFTVDSCWNRLKYYSRLLACTAIYWSMHAHSSTTSTFLVEKSLSSSGGGQFRGWHCGVRGMQSYYLDHRQTGDNSRRPSQWPRGKGVRGYGFFSQAAWKNCTRWATVGPGSDGCSAGLAMNLSRGISSTGK